jgi:hypothetical protein
MGTSQFAFVRMPPGKWASSDSLARVPASGVPTVRLNFTFAVSDPVFLRFAPRQDGRRTE